MQIVRLEFLRFCASTLLLGWTALAWAGESGTLLREDALRDAASTSARTLVKVSKGSQVEILGKQGAWMQVRFAGKTGWVRLLNVRKGSAGQTDVAGGVASVMSLGTQRSDPGRVVATAGVRGLTEEELKGARFDGAELGKLEHFAASRVEAEGFAAEAGLVARKVDYLPSPEAARSGGMGGE